MDSCHSAAWCFRLAKMKDIKNVSIFASCAVFQYAKDLEGGGLLNRCIFGTEKAVFLTKFSFAFSSFNGADCILHK
jgi:hypothetical protein